jgi:hypothetical protein
MDRRFKMSQYDPLISQPCTWPKSKSTNERSSGTILSSSGDLTQLMVKRDDGSLAVVSVHEVLIGTGWNQDEAWVYQHRGEVHGPFMGSWVEAVEEIREDLDPECDTTRVWPFNRRS